VGAVVSQAKRPDRLTPERVNLVTLLLDIENVGDQIAV
jgi:hypothetical protein